MDNRQRQRPTAPVRRKAPSSFEDAWHLPEERRQPRRPNLNRKDARDIYGKDRIEAEKAVERQMAKSEVAQDRQRAAYQAAVREKRIAELSLEVSGIHPSDDDILKKIRKLYKDDPEGFDSDYGLMKERGETPQEWYDQMFDQVKKRITNEQLT